MYLFPYNFFLGKPFGTSTWDADDGCLEKQSVRMGGGCNWL